MLTESEKGKSCDFHGPQSATQDDGHYEKVEKIHKVRIAII